VQTIAVLPIKRFETSKQRLAGHLTRGARRALSEAMFSDVLVALRRASLIHRVLVVSADHGAQRIAGGYGAMVLDDDEDGHNPAARHGVRAAAQAGAERVLLVPADCPMLAAEELDELLARRTERRSAVIVPDRHGVGTNALLLKPPDALKPTFGAGSCERHRQTAEVGGTVAEVVRIPSLALDVDTADDLAELEEALAVRHGGAAHTRGMLRQLSRSRT
jgi:2-phospho-L-lactate guanylyltransferase